LIISIEIDRHVDQKYTYIKLSQLMTATFTFEKLYIAIQNRQKFNISIMFDFVSKKNIRLIIHRKLKKELGENMFYEFHRECFLSEVWMASEFYDFLKNMV